MAPEPQGHGWSGGSSSVVDFTAGAPKPFPPLLTAAQDTLGRSCSLKVPALRCTNRHGGVCRTSGLRRWPMHAMQPGSALDRRDRLLQQDCDATAECISKPRTREKLQGNDDKSHGRPHVRHRKSHLMRDAIL